MNQRPGGDGEHGTTIRARLRVRNEFAMVELVVMTGHTGDRVVVRDVEVGTEIELDALELEALTRVDHESFGPLIVDRFPEEPTDASS